VPGLVGRDRQRVEVVAQETLPRAWRHPQVLHEEDPSPPAGSFSAARNPVIDAHRANRPDHVRCRTACSTVSAHRDALAIVVNEERSSAEAAGLLEVPEGTVRSRCYTAKRTSRPVPGEGPGSVNCREVQEEIAVGLVRLRRGLAA
jgi:RNA polymerase sigma-70 factor, ECF subfamily